VVPQISHLKVAKKNYSKIMIGENDSLKQLYRNKYGTHVQRLDKKLGVREGFSTPRARTFEPLELKALPQKRRDNIVEAPVRRDSWEDNYRNRRHSMLPPALDQIMVWSQQSESRADEHECIRVQKKVRAIPRKNKESMKDVLEHFSQRSAKGAIHHSNNVTPRHESNLHAPVYIRATKQTRTQQVLDYKCHQEGEMGELKDLQTEGPSQREQQPKSS